MIVAVGNEHFSLPVVLTRLKRQRDDEIRQQPPPQGLEGQQPPPPQGPQGQQPPPPPQGHQGKPFDVGSVQEVGYSNSSSLACHLAGDAFLLVLLALWKCATSFLERAMDGIDLVSFIDPKLNSQYDPAQKIRMVTCAAACTRRMPKNRPKMSEVVGMLKGDNPLDTIKQEIKQEIRVGESSYVYISPDHEIEEDAGSSEYNSAARQQSASSSQIQ
ncbi:Protein kinase superfamily protein [Trifolium repens]|nr:Protein kinase superfamily protein [Trifolium repens]